MEWVKYSVWMCSSVDYGLYQGIVKLLQDSTSSYCVSPYSMQYIVHTAAVVSYTHIYCTSLCGQVSVATHHWRHNSDCSIIYMHSYSGTTLTQLLHFSLRTFFFFYCYTWPETPRVLQYCTVTAVSITQLLHHSGQFATVTHHSRCSAFGLCYCIYTQCSSYCIYTQSTHQGYTSKHTSQMSILLFHFNLHHSLLLQ